MEEEKEDLIYAMMGVDSSVPATRPDMDEIYVVVWKPAGIMIPWKIDLSAKESIIEWAVAQLNEDEKRTYL